MMSKEQKSYIDSQDKKMLLGGVESCREVKKVLGFFSFCDVETT